MERSPWQLLERPAKASALGVLQKPFRAMI